MSEVLERIMKQNFPLSKDIITYTSNDPKTYVWRCTWVVREGDLTIDGGYTYSITRSGMETFIGILEKVVDEENPRLYYRHCSIQYVQVERKLFDSLLKRKAGVLHIPEGKHPHDLEAD
jgi:hypothetical protein